MSAPWASQNDSRSESTFGQPLNKESVLTTGSTESEEVKFYDSVGIGAFEKFKRGQFVVCQYENEEHIAQIVSLETAAQSETPVAKLRKLLRAREVEESLRAHLDHERELVLQEQTVWHVTHLDNLLCSATVHILDDRPSLDALRDYAMNEYFCRSALNSNKELCSVMLSGILTQHVQQPAQPPHPAPAASAQPAPEPAVPAPRPQPPAGLGVPAGPARPPHAAPPAAAADQPPRPSPAALGQRPQLPPAGASGQLSPPASAAASRGLARGLSRPRHRAPAAAPADERAEAAPRPAPSQPQPQPAAARHHHRDTKTQPSYQPQHQHQQPLASPARRGILKAARGSGPPSDARETAGWRKGRNRYDGAVGTGKRKRTEAERQEAEAAAQRKRDQAAAAEQKRRLHAAMDRLFGGNRRPARPGPPPSTLRAVKLAPTEVFDDVGDSEAEGQSLSRSEGRRPVSDADTASRSQPLPVRRPGANSKGKQRRAGARAHWQDTVTARHNGSTEMRQSTPSSASASSSGASSSGAKASSSKPSSSEVSSESSSGVGAASSPSALSAAHPPRPRPVSPRPQPNHVPATRPLVLVLQRV